MYISGSGSHKEWESNMPISVNVNNKAARGETY